MSGPDKETCPACSRVLDRALYEMATDYGFGPIVDTLACLVSESVESAEECTIEGGAGGTLAALEALERTLAAAREPAYAADEHIGAVEVCNKLTKRR